MLVLKLCAISLPEGQEVIFERRLDPPSDAFVAGEITWGAAKVTANPDTAGVDGVMTINFTLALVTENIIQPEATP
jgi:hypothetical protein